jgi:hypothetical protein
MRIIILVCFMLLYTNSFLYSQYKLSVNTGYGNYLSNSENSLQITKDSKFHDYLFYGFTLQKEDFFGYNLILEYNYHQIVIDNIVQSVVTGEGDPTPLGYNTGSMSLLSHTIDLDYVGTFDKYFSYGFGPSFDIINRTFKMNLGILGATFSDKLASSALGLNVFADVQFPLESAEKHLFFDFKIKFRNTHSIWFDKGIRNLDNYSQEFITGQILIGLGYSF